MLSYRCGLALCLLCLTATSSSTQGLDVLQGKFAFNWQSNPGRQKCVKVEGRLLADFKSSAYRCDLKPTVRASSGVRPLTCSQKAGTQKTRRREYLIFDTLRACEDERKTQASNG